MHDNNVVITFKWPWTMIPLEYADKWTALIKGWLKKSDSIYGKDIFPSARHEDKKSILLDIDDDGSYAIITFEGENGYNRPNEFQVELLSTSNDVIERIERDHAEALEKYK